MDNRLEKIFGPGYRELLTNKELRDRALEIIGEQYDEQPDKDLMSAEQVDRIFEQVLPKKTVRMFNWRRMAMAASILLVVGLGTYFLFFDKKNTIVPPVIVSTDVPSPQTNRAMITASTGERIYLDSIANGSITTINGVSIVKLGDGKIEYKGAASEVI
ncbi:MAG TPA: hypothetical protein VHM26_14800, partial [Chitinophagaceae bacterium]|nr:hypothetical protein [Chitinophagaceae bacterium]